MSAASSGTLSDRSSCVAMGLAWLLSAVCKPNFPLLPKQASAMHACSWCRMTEEDNKGSHEYRYNSGRTTTRKEGRFIWTNTKAAVCRRLQGVPLKEE